VRRERREQRELSAVLWGMVGAWLWSAVVGPLLARIPVRWRIVGGLLLAGVLLIVCRMPELAAPVLVGTVGLIVATIIRRRRSSPAGDGLEVPWEQVIDESPALQRLRGSRIREGAWTDRGRVLMTIELAGAWAMSDVVALVPNLEAARHLPAGSLEMRASEGDASRVFVASTRSDGDTRPPRNITSETIPSRIMRAGTRTRTREGSAGMWTTQEPVRLQDLKRAADDARARGERRHKGGHRRARA
jgi:hypothetical protein